MTDSSDARQPRRQTATVQQEKAKPMDRAQRRPGNQ